MRDGCRSRRGQGTPHTRRPVHSARLAQTGFKPTPAQKETDDVSVRERRRARKGLPLVRDPDFYAARTQTGYERERIIGYTSLVCVPDVNLMAYVGEQFGLLA